MAEKAKFALGVDFQIEGVPVKGIYSSGALYGEVLLNQDQGRLPEIVPEEFKAVTPDIKVDSVYCIVKGLKAFVLGVRFGHIDLTNLPLVGKKLPSSLSLLIDQLELQIAAGNFSLSAAQPPVKSGVNFSANLQIGKTSIPLSLASIKDLIASQDNNGTQTSQLSKDSTTPSSTSPPSTQDGVMWLNLNKQIGPFYFRRIGGKFSGNTLIFYLDASLSISIVTLALEGLSVGSPIDRFDPQFDLRGLGISFKTSALSITGALLKNTITVDNQKVETYDGMILIQTPTFGISALGSYCKIDRQPSLFIYGVLTMPLGGAPFFFVTGLAAGFGLNRNLNIPPVEKINQFPFVAAAMGTNNLSKDPFQLLRTINDDIPPSVGQYFLAFGIKFTSFKLIDSFALLTFGFGKKITLDIIGLSRLSMPPDISSAINPIAQVEMAFRISYDFDENAIKLKAILTSNSYILSRNCQLTGGFAFYAWFAGKYAGDFVCTLGGYHPQFQVPSYYPTVPRLGFNWKVTNQLNIKGGIYFALTSSAIMAGGNFEATWASGKIKAWFKMGLDLLLAWKPFFYEASVYVNMGVSYKLTVNLLVTKVSKTFTVNLGATLKIWGPDFAGYAKIDLKVISFKIKFGSQKKPQLPPLTWQEFKDSFLPQPKNIGVLTLKAGLLKTTETQINVVDPDDFVVLYNTAIPISQTNLPSISENKPFGIGTMGIVTAQSSITFTAFKGNEDFSAAFQGTAVQSNLPSALWGQADKPSVYKKADVNGKLLEGLLTGLTITPAPKDNPAQTEEKSLADFAYDVELKPKAFDWYSPIQQTPSTQGVSQTIQKTASQRDQLLGNLGIDPKSLSLNGLATAKGYNNAFVVPPKLITSKPQ